MMNKCISDCVIDWFVGKNNSIRAVMTLVAARVCVCVCDEGKVKKRLNC